jgi:hypothetical protein
MATRTLTQATLSSKLVERGWTDTLIARFLPTPDHTKVNPFSSAQGKSSAFAPMRLWALERVEQVEATDQFRVARDKSAIRRQAAQKRADAKKQADQKGGAPGERRQWNTSTPST